MNRQPDGGMIAIGVINIIYGIIMALFAIILIGGDGWVPWNAVWPVNEEVIGSELWWYGLIELILAIMLIVSGFGLFQVAPWARAMSLMWAVFVIAFTVVEAIMGELYLAYFVEDIIYPVVLIVVMSTPAWERAFDGDINEVKID